MSFKPEFEVYGENGAFYRNGQTFATFEEAFASAQSRFNRWMACKNYRVAEVDSAEFPVNYRWDNEQGDVRLESEVENEGV